MVSTCMPPPLNQTFTISFPFSITLEHFFTTVILQKNKDTGFNLHPSLGARGLNCHIYYYISSHCTVSLLSVNEKPFPSTTPVCFPLTFQRLSLGSLRGRLERDDDFKTSSQKCHLTTGAKSVGPC